MLVEGHRNMWTLNHEVKEIKYLVHSVLLHTILPSKSLGVIWQRQMKWQSQFKLPHCITRNNSMMFMSCIKREWVHNRRFYLSEIHVAAVFPGDPNQLQTCLDGPSEHQTFLQNPSHSLTQERQDASLWQPTNFHIDFAKSEGFNLQNQLNSGVCKINWATFHALKSNLV